MSFAPKLRRMMSKKSRPNERKSGFAKRSRNAAPQDASNEVPKGLKWTIPPLPVIGGDIPSPPNPSTDPAGYLRSIHAVRERSRVVFDKALNDELEHFIVDKSCFEGTAHYIANLIKRDHGNHFAGIPAHGRWQQLETGGVARLDQMMKQWPASVNEEERTRRLIDLFVVSVLLDAGAGNVWSYRSVNDGVRYKRSEGLAVASIEMFSIGLFSSDPNQPYQVDSDGLAQLTVDAIRSALQVSSENWLEGLQGRTGILMLLSQALKNTHIFGASGRPGNMLAPILSASTVGPEYTRQVSVPTFWALLMDGLGPIWPKTRTHIGGINLGDAWSIASLSSTSFPIYPTEPSWETVLPFHKLTQWLAYSLMEPMRRLLKVQFIGTELFTGLPEYRNGGLLLDCGLLRLKEEDAKRGLQAFHQNAQNPGQQTYEVVPLFDPGDEVVVEWRAVTIGFLDMLLVEVNRILHLEGARKLSLAQMLEAGTWKGGRETAAIQRPIFRGPPIMIRSDGTVF